MNGTILAIATVGALALTSPRAGSANTTSLWYHLTDRPKFKLNPRFAPADNSVAIFDRGGRPGIYIGKDMEPWVNGHGYWRPFVVELAVDESVKEDPETHGRYLGEMFVPASSFKKITVQRVIPIDAYCREKYGDYGWIEEATGRTFDTGEPIPRHAHNALRGYRYTGPDVRTMSTTETRRLIQQLRRVKPRSSR